MLDYAVDPAILRPLVPAGVALDRLDGRALVTVVGFRFLRTRVLGIAIPGHRDFDEVNLRFYVRREVDGEVRRGVTFVRELVPRLAIALVARAVFNEPYRAVPMRHHVSAERRSYEWRAGGRWQHVAASTVGDSAVPAPESEGAFVTQRQWGYTRQRDGRTIEYEVRHPVWRVWAAESPSLAADVAGLWGAAFVPALSGPPLGALVAEGSAVTVSAPVRIA